MATLDSIGLPDEQQGESLTTEDGGKIALIGSEGSRQPVLRVDLVAQGLIRASQATGSGASEEPPAVANGAATTPANNARSLLRVSRNTLLLAGIGGAAMVLLAYGFVVLMTRRR